MPHRETQMKVSREQVQQNRNRILNAAAALFREHGFDEVTVSQVMQAAGLTHGAFYGHFSSKEDLINQAVGHISAQAKERDTALGEPARYADVYLGKDHRDHIGSSCPMSSMGTDAARASDTVRRTLTEGLKKQIDRFAAASPGQTDEARRRAAIATWSAMVGAIVLARMVDDESLSDEILSATRSSLRVT
jgi:TetR/AcrR family transcriptional regulator, transcriptional repressor for nem operon